MVSDKKFPTSCQKHKTGHYDMTAPHSYFFKQEFVYCFHSNPPILPDHSRCFLSDHYAGCVGVPEVGNPDNHQYIPALVFPDTRFGITDASATLVCGDW